jgi:magnesium transporter
MAAPLTEKNLNDPVTEHMRRDCARLFAYQTVGEALDGVRRNPPEGRIIYFYVVDEENRLQGVVPTRRLLLSAADTPVTAIMIRHVIALPAHATVLEACEFFTLHRFLAFPVLDDERHLVGVVDMELYTDELSDLGGRDQGDDLFQLIASTSRTPGRRRRCSRSVCACRGWRATSAAASRPRSCRGCTRRSSSGWWH